MSTVKDVAIGIDLGTTYSCVAFWDENADKVEIIANDQGNRTTPSYVAFTDTERLIGNAAKNQVSMNPENTIYDAKRLIGRKWSDPTVQSDMKHWTFHVVRGANDLPLIEADYKGERKQFRPEEISAMVLTKMKETAEARLGRPVTKAVITVPAYFNDVQRQTTIDAGTIAGLKVLRIINEPTAAAMAYGLEETNSKERNVLIFDWGGGTHDVSLLTMEDGVFQVKATDGDTHLGGEDIDNILTNHAVEEFKKKHKKDPTINPRSIRRLKTACERAKQTLSASPEATIDIDSFFEGVDFQMTITRARFEDLCMSIFKKTLIPVENVMKHSKLGKAQIDEVVLVGGSTRIPKVQQLLSEYFNGKILNKSVNPDEAVAYGAAVQAFMLNGGESRKTKEVLVIDVAPLSLGLETCGQVMTKIIERNTTKPCKRSQIFSTAEDNQDAVDIVIFEGERPLTKDNNRLGHFRLDKIPPAPRGIPKIEVTFDLDANGILNVSAKDLGTQNESRTIINRDRLTSSKEQIKRMHDEAEKFKADDQKNLEKIEARNKLHNLIATIQSMIDKAEYKDKFPTTEIKKVANKCQEITKWLDQNLDPSLEECETKQKELDDLWTPIVTQMYQTTGSQPDNTNMKHGNNESSTDGIKVEEVD